MDFLSPPSTPLKYSTVFIGVCWYCFLPFLLLLSNFVICFKLSYDCFCTRLQITGSHSSFFFLTHLLSYAISLLVTNIRDEFTWILYSFTWFCYLILFCSTSINYLIFEMNLLISYSSPSMPWIFSRSSILTKSSANPSNKFILAFSFFFFSSSSNRYFYSYCLNYFSKVFWSSVLNFSSNSLISFLLFSSIKM